MYSEATTTQRKPQRRIVNGRRVSLATSIWVRHHGHFPPDGTEIDHINGNPHDNRIENLRVATRTENNWNRTKYRNNSSGEKGVKIDAIHHRWQVKVHAGPVRVYAYASHKISAIVAARLIRRTLHGEFALENRPTTETTNTTQ
jgi:hypothetical protein